MAEGYDREPMEGAGKFLRLKSKGDQAKVRLLSLPYREPIVWPAGEGNGRKPVDREAIAKYSKQDWVDILRSPEWQVQEAFYWLVIDRSDGFAKILQATGGVYKKIKKYAEMPEWGDPREFDLVIERTEEPGASYYSVEALPNKTPILHSEIEKGKEIDILKEIPTARLNSEEQIDDVSEEMEAHRSQPKQLSGTEDVGERHSEIMNDPDAPKAEEPKAAQKPPAFEEVDDPPVNLDDIPF